MFVLFKNENSVENFWSWFSENENKFRDFQSNPEKYLNDIISKIKKVSDGIAIELEPPNKGIINMTISADGVSELFPIVLEIVNKAPKINGWNFYAFRQRMSKENVKGMVLKAQDHELSPDEMKFFPLVNDNRLDIIIFAKNITEENYNNIAYGGLLIVDNILGEYDCVTKVNGYDFHNMPTDLAELNNLFPLLELADFVDDFYKKK